MERFIFASYYPSESILFVTVLSLLINSLLLKTISNITFYISDGLGTPPVSEIPPTDEELENACKLAQAHDFIMSFPDKYDTYIEQGGTNVSGGQKQRICIARALLKKPKILILDDSTSAVDTKTDALIRKAFKEEIPDTTKLIVAQRISSIMEADIIIVMENGAVNAVGTHDELLKNNTIYQEVYYTQNKIGGASNED